MPNPEPTLEGQLLRRAIKGSFSPDPWRCEVNPDVIEAVALLVEGMGEVSRKRRESLADDPWRNKPAERHLDHAVVHIDTAFHAVVEGEPMIGLDRETGLPHLLHCALRCAFAYARQNGIGGPP